MKRREFIIRTANITGVAAGSLMGVACVSKPQMTLHHAEIRTASPLGITMEVFFTVFNDNSFDVEVRNVRVQTVLQSRYTLPAIQYSPNTWLPSDRSVLVSAPVIIPWALVPPLLAETISFPEIKYHVKGSADVTATRSMKVKSDNYPVEESGSIPRFAVLQAAQTMFPTIQ